jgi:Glycosyl transferase family 2
MHTPQISVITAVYNGARFLEETIRSVLSQSFSDFEYLLVDDGSTDNSVAVIESFSDTRIRLIKHTKNQGVVAARSTAFAYARGEFVALTDQDDVSLANRFTAQINFLRTHTDIDLAACWEIEAIESEGGGNVEKVKKFRRYEGKQLHYALLFRNPIGNSTLMVRREKVPVPAYNPEYALCEDYNFIVKMGQGGGLALMPQKFVVWRDHGGNFSTIKAKEMKCLAMRLQGEQLLRLGIDCSNDELLLHNSIAILPRIESIDQQRAIAQWLNKLIREVDIENADRQVFKKVIAQEWFDCAQRSAHLGFEAWKVFHQAKLVSRDDPDVTAQALFKLWLKCLIKR